MINIHNNFNYILNIQTLQFVHQANSDAPVDSAFQQATDVMVCLVAPTEVMKLAAVSF